MTAEQQKAILSSKSKFKLALLGLIALFALGLLARLFTGKITGDMSKFYFIWYQNILDNGAAVAFREHLIGYTPAFWYLFAGTTLLDPILPRVTAIKLLPILFDFISTYFVYKIVRIKYPRGNLPYWAAGAFFILPTIFINSAHWGQMDALSLVAAFFNPELWIVPFAFQLSSGLASSVYLKGKSPEPVMYGAIINTIILIVLIVFQFSRNTNTLREVGTHESIH